MFRLSRPCVPHPRARFCDDCIKVQCAEAKIPRDEHTREQADEPELRPVELHRAEREHRKQKKHEPKRQNAVDGKAIGADVEREAEECGSKNESRGAEERKQHGAKRTVLPREGKANAEGCKVDRCHSAKLTKPAHRIFGISQLRRQARKPGEVRELEGCKHGIYREQKPERCKYARRVDGF